MLTRKQSLELVKRLRIKATRTPGLPVAKRRRLMEIASGLQSARAALDRKKVVPIK